MELNVFLWKKFESRNCSTEYFGHVKIIYRTRASIRSLEIQFRGERPT
jgi:hypothetical protein